MSSTLSTPSLHPHQSEWEIDTRFLKKAKVHGQSVSAPLLLHKSFVLTSRVVELDIYASTVLIVNPCCEPDTFCEPETGTWYIVIADDCSPGDFLEMPVWNMTMPSFRPSRIVVRIL